MRNKREDEMVWERKAREAIEQAMEDIEFDEIRGVAVLSTQKEFGEYNALYHKLIQIGEDAWTDYVPFEGGEAVFEPSVDGYAENVIIDHNVEEFFETLTAPDEGGEIFASAHYLSLAGSKILRVDLETINGELIRYLARHPEKMYELQPRKFEELIAELLRDMGYQVELTPCTRDGGFDIRAVQKSAVGTALALVECKRFGPNQKAGVQVVRGLYGVVEAEKATTGVIATTSFFTKDAKAFHAQQKHRISLVDFDKLAGFLKCYRKLQTAG